MSGFTAGPCRNRRSSPWRAHSAGVTFTALVGTRPVSFRIDDERARAPRPGPIAADRAAPRRPSPSDLAGRPGHGVASWESGSGPLLTRLRLALRMFFTGRTSFFRDHAQGEF